MKSSSWKFGTLAAMAVAATTFVSQAQAAFVSLSFAPATITTAGDAVGVDIVVNGLGVATGGFSLDLGYANLAFTTFTVGPGGTLGAAPFDLSLGDLGGTVSLNALADGLISESALYTAQSSGGPFTLAHVDFTGVAPGAFTLDLKNVALSDFAGTALVVCTGAACVNNVPEPTTGLLVAAALGALGLSRKRQPEA